MRGVSALGNTADGVRSKLSVERARRRAVRSDGGLNQDMADGRHSVSMASDARGARRAKRAKFADDLKPMMFGFGDDAVPFDDTVSLVEDIVIDFIKSVVRCRELAIQS
jgi:hypothetical protein